MKDNKGVKVLLKIIQRIFCKKPRDARNDRPINDRSMH